MDLLDILEDLIKCIDGKWFIGNGALLGIIRQRSLLEYDTDIDLYLLPNSTINFEKLSKYNLDYQHWYSDLKIFSTLNPKNKKNKWLEYCSYIKTHNLNLDRPRVFSLAKETYKEKGLQPKFTMPYIDVYFINEDLKVDQWPETYYFQNEIETREYNCFKFPVNIPIGYKNILNRNYGYKWKEKDPNWKYF